MRVAVVGASGYVGSHLVPRLIAEGHTVRAVARRRAVLEGRGWAGVELVEADALDRASLERALEGIEVAYYLVHSMGSGSDFAARDRLAATNFREAAAHCGLTRIIYLGGLESAGSEHLRSRRETGELLRGGSVAVTELRAGMVVGAGSAAFEVIRDLVNHLPVMITPKWVTSRSRPIAMDDLLAYLVGVLAVPSTGGMTLDIGGPETLSYRDLMKQFAEVTGGGRQWIIPVPVLSPRISSYWLDLVTAVPASIARPLIDGLKQDLLPNDGEIRRLIPIPLTPYREAVRRALEDERANAVVARWTEGSLAFRGYDPTVSFYSKGTATTVPVRAPASATWSVVSSIGGRSGYYFGDGLWRLRGAMDRLLGGVGMRRGRRHPTRLHVGDAVDFWRVAAVEEGKRLTLVAEMKLPGAAVLEFVVSPTGPDSSELTMTARFHPAGILGLLYWYAISPAHGSIFSRTPKAMAQRAEWLATVQVG